MELGDLAETVRRFAELLEWNGEIEELMKKQEVMVGSAFRHSDVWSLSGKCSKLL